MEYFVYNIFNKTIKKCNKNKYFFGKNFLILKRKCKALFLMNWL